MRFFTNSARFADEYARYLAEMPDTDPNALPEYLIYDYDKRRKSTQ
jgi:hypothetical protein